MAGANYLDKLFKSHLQELSGAMFGQRDGDNPTRGQTRL